MDVAITRTIALFQESPIYWAGILLWLFGFLTYVPAACGRGSVVLSRTGTALCWLGFGLTLLAYVVIDGRYRVPELDSPVLDAAYWFRSDTQIWLLWFAGAALIIGSWLRWLTQRAGWLGLALGMTGVIASWLTEESDRRVVILVGCAIVGAFLLVTLWRGELRRQHIKPGDYETELIALCAGSWWRANRLIRAEMKRQPGLSRAGAALAVVTRLRHERDPPPGL